jgi:hypothetical protein
MTKNLLEPTKKYVSPDGTIRFIKEGKLHNFDGPALIPEGNMKKAEWYVFGIPYSKKQFEEIKKHNNGLPWYKQSKHKQR